MLPMPSTPPTALPTAVPAAPLSNAERQRRHRAKRKAEAARAAAERSGSAVACVIYENKTLRNRIEAAQRNAAEAKPLREERDALRLERETLLQRLDDVRCTVRTLVSSLTPGGRQLARRHLQARGYADWIDGL